MSAGGAAPLAGSGAGGTDLGSSGSEPEPAFTTYEAEALKLLGTHAIVYEDGAASGGKGVAYLQEEGDGFALQGGAPEGSMLMMRYAAKESGQLSAYVNGRKVGAIHFDATGAFIGSYAEAFLPIEIPSNAWLALRKDAGDGFLNVDFIGVGPAGMAAAYEAEDAEMLGAARTYDDAAAVAGGGVAHLINAGEDGIRLRDVRPGKGLTLRYAAVGDGTLSVYVNGEKRGLLGFASTGDWLTSYARASFMTDIPEQATIELRRDVGDAAANLDQIQVLAPTSLRRAPLTGDGPSYAQLEPKAGIIHGAGQDPQGFAEYRNALEAGYRPALFMANVDLGSDELSEWGQTLRHELESYPEWLLPQIGLSFGEDVSDEQIDLLLEALSNLGRPAYLRIGYGFNAPWNDYEPESFRNVFRRIAQSLRASGLEIATVWSAASIGADENTEQYYPGDDVVDWWGLNLYGISFFTAGTWADFAEEAAAHRKPLMIAESTPARVGVNQGQASYDAWFKPYFAFLSEHEAIKAFCYINWDWAYWSDVLDSPSTSAFGDARIDQNATVLKNYRKEMRRSVYQHASAEDDFRAKLGPARPTVEER